MLTLKSAHICPLGLPNIFMDWEIRTYTYVIMRSTNNGKMNSSIYKLSNASLIDWFDCYFHTLQNEIKTSQNSTHSSFPSSDSKYEKRSWWHNKNLVSILNFMILFYIDEKEDWVGVKEVLISLWWFFFIKHITQNLKSWGFLQ